MPRAGSRPVRRRVALGGLGALVIAVAAACSPTEPAATVRTVELTARFSRFTPATVRVESGTVVRFVVRNTDPIAHELIVGDDATHERHEAGTEPSHTDRPGEVSVAVGATAVTTYRFSRPGTVTFGCHLPGHWAYGMRGTVTVT